MKRLKPVTDVASSRRLKHDSYFIGLPSDEWTPFEFEPSEAVKIQNFSTAAYQYKRRGIISEVRRRGLTVFVKGAKSNGKKL